MVKRHIHIIGGGLAGLSAAVSLSHRSDTQVILYEGSPACGGRARSFYDVTLDRLIDNGNHLILSGNEAVFEYLRLIDATHSLMGSGFPLFPFVDLEEEKRWDLQLSKGIFPWWLLFPKRRVPDVKLRELISLLNLLKAKANQTVANCLVSGQFSRRLLKPFAISALNTPCEEASARLLGAVFRQSLMKGGKACIPYFPKEGLSETFVNPALSLIKTRGGKVHTTSRLSEVHIDNGQVDYLMVNDKKIEISHHDQVILALNPNIAEQILLPILPNIKVPNQFESILNLHYAVDPKVQAKGTIDKAKFVGVIGGISEWIFVKQGVISITISAANRFIGCNQSNLASLIWQEIRTVLNPVLEQPLPEEMPIYRLLYEKRASFAATVEQSKRRASCYMPYHNLFLAGDWVATGLPATIEGAIRSGFSASQAALNSI